jgi:alginate O-acetyltransferase complex protein AlgI
MGGWVLFRSHSLEHSIVFYQSLLGLSGSNTIGAFYYIDNQVVIAIVAGILGSTPIIKFARPLLARGFAWTGVEAKIAVGYHLTALAGLFVLSAATLAGNSYNPFIYFRF